MERVELALVERETRGHGVTAAAVEKPERAGVANDCADIDAGNRTRRTSSLPAFESDHECGLAKPVLQSACDDADDSGVPAFVRQQNEWRVALIACGRHGLL